jgi:aldehyde dehydrogenase (NAD(P)+)
MVVQNASFNCLAGKMLVTARGFRQRDELFERIGRLFSRTPARVAYYPGAHERYRSLVESADDARIQRFGDTTGGRLPWTLIAGLDAEERSPLFEIEPFSAIISETSVGSTDPVEYLARATEFANDRLWGTLNATVMIPSHLEQDTRVGRALEEAVTGLRYGTVGVNLWPAIGYGMGTAPWGGYPGSSLRDVQSGIGWSHNALMLEKIEKSVCRSPLPFGLPEYIWYPGHRRLQQLGRAIARVEAEQRPRGVLSAAWALLQR